MTSNVILYHIHQILGNLEHIFNITKTYVDKDDPWLGILDATEIEISSTTNMWKGYSLCQLVFGRDMINKT